MVTVLLLAAGTPSPSDSGNFKALFEQGEKLFLSGEYGAAIYVFQQADTLRATPEVAFDLAKCNHKLGEEALAAYYYRLYLRRSPNASDALEVSSLIADILTKKEGEGRGLLEIESPEAGEVVVQGHRYPSFPVAVFLPPGDYEVISNFRVGQLRRSGSVRTGRASTLRMDPTSAVLVPAPSSPAVRLDSAPARSPRRTAHAVSYAVIGVAAAALIAGTVFGAMSQNDAGQLQANMPYTLQQSYAASANQKATTANVLWGSGGGLGIAGGLLFAFTMPEPGIRHE